eukprot:TRINITY_DN73709_c0_g1_i1.p1 TRINITY_DN73709_c0_g1~~TRINITY_DN73709_c0_g1_i1.p1  ORF type:complete len:547 (-),score=103.46 TRINITY_DN73709_c0_g1_i1:87-1727(-)
MFHAGDDEPSAASTDAAAAHGDLGEPAPEPQEQVAASAEVVDFDRSTWDPSMEKYGLLWLLQVREAMMPIQKPREVSHLKFLIWPSASPNEDRDYEYADRDRLPSRRESGRSGNDDRKGKGKGGKDKAERSSGYSKQTAAGRYVPDMGRTEPLLGTEPGQWWRNVAPNDVEVIVRESFMLTSNEIARIRPGHYVQQAGVMEVFVSGQAQGLKRMPVQPRGWVSVDASSVGGPKYLDPAGPPRWKVIFASGSKNGDIVVREKVSLESDEVAKLLCGTCVEQSGPLALLEDGIIRMPISFTEGGREASSPSQPGKKRTGWVTCDATAQGGPKFFELSPEEVPLTTSPAGVETDRAKQHHRSQQREDRDNAGIPTPTFGVNALAAPGAGGSNGSQQQQRVTIWDKNRMWRVSCQETGHGEAQVNMLLLAVVNRPDPFPPGTMPTQDILVRWLKDGDIVEQVGHSKKTRGYMVMPIRVVEDQTDGTETKVDGWVTRRLVDKTRDGEGGSWFVEIGSCDGEEGGRERRRQARARRNDEALATSIDALRGPA